MRRPLIINGFMATGKTETAKTVAEKTGRPLVDLDDAIEQSEGRLIRRIFETEGEQYFRAVERAAFYRALSREDAPVIAVGGGALLSRSMRLDAMEKAVVVTLRAPIETLLQRIHGGGNSRPLARGGEASIAERLELRAPSYAEAHEVVDVGDGSVGDIADRVLTVWKRDPLGVAAGASSYSVEVGQGIFAPRLEEEIRGATLGFLITDDNVDPLYGDAARKAMDEAGVRHATFRLTPGEEHKNPDSLVKIWQRVLEAGADRKSRFVGLGGGVATDVAGFAAATWMRGVSWFSAPTTLLGMVDASVGGKTAVDLPGAKNCVGAFWQPKRVLCDVAHLKTEADRGFRSALAEIVKTALIGDAEMLTLLEEDAEATRQRDPSIVEQLVRRCVAVKARVVSRDEREGGLRASLNLGHTLGHALEAHGGFGALTHGEAVSLGLVAALKVGERLGVGDETLTRRTTALLAGFCLPTDLSKYPLAEAAALVANDKKRSGAEVRFVLTPEPGRIEFRSLDIEQLQGLTKDLA